MKPLIAVVLAVFSSSFSSQAAEDLRVGMIGLDTSHVIAFTRLLNDSNHPQHVPGARVVAAFKGGSPDVEASRTRVDRFTEQLQSEFGVHLYDSIEELCRHVDAVMLESVDGRPHLEQARPVILAGKPLFIDKPLAGSLRDAIRIYELARKHNVPWFSSSSYRFYDSLSALRQRDAGEIKGAISYGPCAIEPNHPDLFWYGVHSAEALYTVMGRGCETVVRTATKDTDVVTGVWSDGKVGTLRGLRNAATPHRVILFGTKGVFEQPDNGGGYRPLVFEIVKFFQTRVPPVAPEETIEMFAFMEAADESKRRGGRPVAIEEVMREHSR